MPAKRSANGGDRDARGRFAKGNRASVGHGPPRMAVRQRLLRKLPPDAVEQVGERLFELANAGDVHAMRLFVERLGGKPRTEPTTLQLDLGELDSATDCAKAATRLAAAVANGQVDPDDAAKVAGVLETARRAYETAELEQRIEALEASYQEADQ